MQAPSNQLISFHKYEGTGNDFIVISRRSLSFPLSGGIVRTLCARKRGIGADGVLLVEESVKEDFHLQYFNADGSRGICANGARCAAAAAADLGIPQKKEKGYTFSMAGHEIPIQSIQKVESICLQWEEKIQPPQSDGDEHVIQVGGWHCVRYVQSNKALQTVTHALAKKLQNDKKRFPEGVNVHFAYKDQDGKILMRSFERGVPEETYSCGTGAIAIAIVERTCSKVASEATLHIQPQKLAETDVLQVQLRKKQGQCWQILLTGAVRYVYQGLRRI